MTWTFPSNTTWTPATGGWAMWNQIACLIAAGWTKKADSDGLTNGVLVTGGGIGAGGLNNTKAWVRLQDPSGTGGREFVIQRGVGAAQYRIKYSASAGFTGSSGLTQTPTATDEQVLCGSGIGTDSAPAFINFFPTTDGTYRCYSAADNAAKYGFYMFFFTTGGANPSGAWVFDPLTAGTYPSQDNDPVVHYLNTNSALRAGYYDEGTGSVGYLKKGLSGEGFVNIPALTYSTGSRVSIPVGMGTNPHNGDDEGFAVAYARPSALAAPVGWKGVGSVARWMGVNRSTGDTVNSKARIVAGWVTLPWDSTSTPSV